MSIQGKDFIKTNANEAVKEYVTYDIQGRLEYLYSAPLQAKTGDPCLVTRYGYTTPTSTQVQYRREDIGQWDTTWEMF